MSLHGFITATTTANQSVLINVDEISTVVSNVNNSYCKIKMTDGEVYPVFLSTSEVEDKIFKAQMVSATHQSICKAAKRFTST